MALKEFILATESFLASDETLKQMPPHEAKPYLHRRNGKDIYACYNALLKLNSPPDEIAWAMKTGEEVFGKNNKRKAEWLFIVATSKLKPGDFVSGKAMLKQLESLVAADPKLSKEPIHQSCLLLQLSVCEFEKDWSTALSLQHKVTDWQQAVFGDKSKEHGEALFQTGVCQGRLKDYEQAEVTFSSAMEILERHIEKDSLSYQNYLKLRATNLQTAERLQDALPFWNQLERLTRDKGNVHRQDAIAGLVAALKATGQTESAEKYTKELKSKE